MHILKEGRDFKTFLKENYAIVSGSCTDLLFVLIYYKYVEHGIEHDIECLQSLHTLYIPEMSVDFINTFQFKEMVNLLVC